MQVGLHSEQVVLIRREQLHLRGVDGERSQGVVREVVVEDLLLEEILHELERVVQLQRVVLLAHQLHRLLAHGLDELSVDVVRVLLYVEHNFPRLCLRLQVLRHAQVAE